VLTPSTEKQFQLLQNDAENDAQTTWAQRRKKRLSYIEKDDTICFHPAQVEG
jgi:hypothetical protein